MEKPTVIIDECAFCPYYKDEAVKKEHDRWMGKLNELKNKINRIYANFYKDGHYDAAHGTCAARDLIIELIKEEAADG